MTRPTDRHRGGRHRGGRHRGGRHRGGRHRGGRPNRAGPTPRTTRRRRAARAAAGGRGAPTASRPGGPPRAARPSGRRCAAAPPCGSADRDRGTIGTVSAGRRTGPARTGRRQVGGRQVGRGQLGGGPGGPVPRGAHRTGARRTRTPGEGVVARRLVVARRVVVTGRRRPGHPERRVVDDDGVGQLLRHRQRQHRAHRVRRAPPRTTTVPRSIRRSAASRLGSVPLGPGRDAVEHPARPVDAHEHRRGGAGRGVQLAAPVAL